MNLKTAATCAIIGFSAKFLLHTVGTVLPSLFVDLTVACLSLIVMLAAGIAILYFFVAFLREYVGSQQGELRTASNLAIFASALGLVITVKRLLIMGQTFFPPELIQWLVRARYIETVTPLITSVCIVYWFLALRRDMIQKNHSSMIKPVTLALAGSIAGLLLPLVTFMTYVGSRGIALYRDFLFPLGFLLFPLAIFSFATLIYFFVALNRSLSE